MVMYNRLSVFATGAYGHAHVDQRHVQERPPDVAGTAPAADRQRRQGTGLPTAETRHLLPSVPAGPVPQRHPPAKGTYLRPCARQRCKQILPRRTRVRYVLECERFEYSRNYIKEQISKQIKKYLR